MFQQETADAICARLCEGDSLREICRTEGMPDKATVMRWLNAHPEFRDQYARAKETGIEAVAEDILDIADDGRNDWMKRSGSDEEPGWVFNGEAARRSQIRIDARKWLLSKLAPKKYGDKVDLNHSGRIAVARDLSDDELTNIATSGSARTA